jgi:hypothetical protein
LTPLAIVEELHAGSTRDYCLYLPPPGNRTERSSNVSWPSAEVDIEGLLIRAFHPLPMLALDETGRQGGGFDALPDEIFLLLAENARVLLWVPVGNDARFAQRLRLLKGSPSLSRAIFLMPGHGSFGTPDWTGSWTAARSAAADLGIELSAYTAGGWLFRLGREGRACTFRPIANPNPDKIARAIEAICVEMDAGG